MAARVPAVSRWGQPPTTSAPAAERVAEQGPLVGAGLPGDRPPAQGDDLHVDDVGDAPAHFDERLDAGQAAVQGRVDVRADGGEAVGGHQPRRPLGPGDRLVESEQVAAGDHRLDGSEQVARRVRDQLGQERLVEVGVRLDGGGQQDVTVEVDDVVAGRRDHVADGADALATDAHVGRRSVGQRRPAQHDIGHPPETTHW